MTTTNSAAQASLHSFDAISLAVLPTPNCGVANAVFGYCNGQLFLLEISVRGSAHLLTCIVWIDMLLLKLHMRVG